MTPTSISYSKPLSIVMVVVGALLLVASLFGPQWIGVFAGAVLTLLGILALVNPIVTIESTEVQLRSPLGFTTKRFPITSPADLRVDGKSLVFVPSGKKITSLGFGIDSADADRVRALVSGPTA